MHRYTQTCTHIYTHINPQALSVRILGITRLSFPCKETYVHGYPVYNDIHGGCTI